LAWPRCWRLHARFAQVARDVSEDLWNGCLAQG
jgi:hypothetical protein